VSALGARVQFLVERAVVVRPGEMRALLLSFVYFFSLLTSYYILRPLREEMGIASGVENLQWLFTGTFFAMLAAVPAFGWLVSRVPRRRLVPVAYRFFLVNILIFYALLSLEVGMVQVARAFYIWISLFNLFVVSVFWSFMADLFRNEQARRLFGFIAAGGSLGALLGPGLTATLAVPLGPVNLLLVSALFLEVAVQCVRRLLREDAVRTSDAPAESTDEPPIGGGIFAGITACSSAGTGREISADPSHGTTSTKAELDPIEWPCFSWERRGVSWLRQPPRSTDFPGSPMGS